MTRKFVKRSVFFKNNDYDKKRREGWNEGREEKGKAERKEGRGKRQ